MDRWREQPSRRDDEVKGLPRIEATRGYEYSRYYGYQVGGERELTLGCGGVVSDERGLAREREMR